MIKKLAILIFCFCLMTNGSFAQAVVTDIIHAHEVKTVTIQRGVWGTVEDTYLRDGAYASNNYGTSSILYCKNSSTDYNRTALIKFDVSFLPPEASILSASITVRNSGMNSGTITTRIYKLIQDFEEDEATWNDPMTGVAWGAGGARGSWSDMIGDFATELKEVGHHTTNTAYETITYSSPAVANVVQAGVNGSNMNGWAAFVIHNASSGDYGYDFYSSEYSVIEDRPKLVITYDLTGRGMARSFTDGTEVDPGSDITKSSSHEITFTTMPRNVKSYVYYDMGVGSIKKFVYYVRLIVTGGSWSNMSPWAVSNTLGGYYDFDAANDGIYIQIYKREADNDMQFTLVNAVNGSYSQTSSTFSTNTEYYLKITRDYETVTAEVHDDWQYTNLLETMTVASDDTAYRYYYQMTSQNGGDTNSMSGELERWYGNSVRNHPEIG